ncbi:MAG: DUF2723 domain-containing protein [Polyangiaceae bacterium]
MSAPRHLVLAPSRVFGLGSALALAWFAPRVARDLTVMGDSPELVAAAAEWGVPHAPGYPLFTLLGHLAAKLPFGNMALRVNALSAVEHALAVGVVGLLAQRITGSFAAAVGAAALLAVSKTFLLGSLYAEVFPLNDLFFALVLWLAVAAKESSGRLRARSWLLAIGAFGLGLAHHHMLLLGVPAFALLAGPSLRRSLAERELTLGACFAALFTPMLVSFGLLWWAARHDATVSSGDVHDLRSFAELLLRADYGGPWSSNRHATSEPASDRVGAFVLLLLASVGPLGIVAAALGAFTLVRIDRRVSLAMVVALVAVGPVFAALNRISVDGEAPLAYFERFTAMSHVPLAVLVGVGVSMLGGKLPLELPGRRALEVGLCLVPALAALSSTESVDLSRDWSGRALRRDLLRGVPEGALVLVSGDEHLGVAQYLCAVEGACDRITVIAPGQLFLPWKLAQTRRRAPDVFLPDGAPSVTRTHEILEVEARRRPVFVTPALLRKDRVLAERFQVVPTGLLARVYATAEDAERDRATTLARIAELARGEGCEGCALDPRDVMRPSQHLYVLLTYSALLESAARLAARDGAPADAARILTRMRAIDAVIGPVLVALPPKGAAE